MGYLEKQKARIEQELEKQEQLQVAEAECLQELNRIRESKCDTLELENDLKEINELLFLNQPSL